MPDRLLLDSLSIQGYRAFDHLEIPRLGRVNLLVGRNAVGKSTVLEAVELWASDLSEVQGVLATVLSERQEIDLFPRPGQRAEAINWLRLFHGARSWSTESLSIGPVAATNAQLVVAQRQGRWAVQEDRSRHFVLTDAALAGSSDSGRDTEPALLVGRDTRVVYNPIGLQASVPPLEPRPPCMRLRSRGLSPSDPPNLWDRTTLAGREDHVIDAMRLVEPSIERLTFVEPPVRRSADGAMARPAVRLPMVKREGREIEPLRALGDGIVRLLELTLALVNVPGGMLLVDEIENGVHYQVQPDLWRQVFTVAAALDVQVFAATHSWDCIAAFQAAAAEHAGQGLLVRLERDAHGNRAKVFEGDELATITGAEIEVR